MIESNLHNKYLKNFFISIPLILFFISMFNFVIDPYGIYNSTEIKGLNMNKPAIKSHLRMSKAYKIKHLKPQAIILGTSRAEFGLDPDHRGFDFDTTYNLNLSGGNTYEILRYFQHAIMVSNIDQTILALDFFQFNINTKNSPDFLENRLASYSDNIESTQRMPLSDIIDSLLTFDAFKSSLETIASQSSKPTYLKNGLIDPETTSRGKLINIIGQRQLFINSEKRYFDKTYRNMKLKSTENNLNSLSNFRNLVSLAYKKNIDLRILINPSHVRQFEVIALSGLWPTFEAWKVSLAEINEEEAKLNKKEPFPIWDFSTYNFFTTERVPELGDIDTKMNWYWESSHFSKELGDIVLDNIFGYPVKDNSPKKYFGTLINTNNIYSHLQNIRVKRDIWRNENLEDIKEIESLSKEIH
tara:strand:- start:8233 stop:9474 length:1242 start_codon:yes stop_codon:yes gene_type:complete